MPFITNQLTTVIVNNSRLRKMFSSNTVELLSSNAYKKAQKHILLLSVICLIDTMSYQLNKKKEINLEPVEKLLYCSRNMTEWTINKKGVMSKLPLPKKFNIILKE